MTIWLTASSATTGVIAPFPITRSWSPRSAYCDVGPIMPPLPAFSGELEGLWRRYEKRLRSAATGLLPALLWTTVVVHRCGQHRLYRVLPHWRTTAGPW